MRKYLIISVSILAFLIFSSKKCDSPESENTAREEMAFNAYLDSINKGFEADAPSEQTLRAFEVKAKQKLVDFADYLQIYMDKSLDDSFKDNARQMILDLFISDSILINLKVSDELKETDVTIMDFLKVVSASGFVTTAVLIDSIEISVPLQKIGNSKYAGSLKFSLQFKGSSSEDISRAGSNSNTVDMIAAKVKKQFGKDTMQLWQVYLGNIR